MSSTSGREPWVAVIDDDDFVRRSLARLLRVNGINARTFQSAQEYLGDRPPTPPACIVLDVHLRDAMSGMELSEHISAEPGSPPVIFITGQEAEELGPRAGIGSSVFLRKPFEPTVLLDLVLQRIGRDTLNGMQ